MGIEKCDVFYDDNPAATYYAGQTVNGRIEFTFNSTKKFRGVKICFLGEAYVTWTESNRSSTGASRRRFRGIEEYYKFSYYLMGSDSGEDLELPPGTHSFPFTCALPAVLPTSFEGEYGYVRYTIKVVIGRPWKFDNQYKFAFTVLSIYDLNLNQALKEEMSRSTIKTFGCLFCKSAPFTMNVLLPCAGFVPGQSILMKIDCDNGSNDRIRHLRITLLKELRYHAKTPYAKIRRHVQEIAILQTSKGVLPHENIIFVEKLLVPPLPASDLANCGIIDINYKIAVKAQVGCCSTSPQTTVPIKIGTVPIRERINLLQGSVTTETTLWLNQPRVAVTSQAHATTGRPLSTASGYSALENEPLDERPPSYSQIENGLYSTLPEQLNALLAMPPPTYEESQYRATTIQGQDDSEFTNVAQNFAPRYPVYNFS